MSVHRHALVGIAAALTVTACTKGEAPAAAETPVAETAPAAQTQGRLTIEGEGLRLLAASGTATSLAFGAPQADVLVAVTTAVGGATPGVTTNSECGEGPVQFAEFSNGLNLAFQDGKFAGWFLDAAGLTTADGIGVGKSRAELDAARTVEIDRESTLGIEFQAGDVGGFLTADGAAGTVESLYAGTTCFFR
jgi:hypothetical protein